MEVMRTLTRLIKEGKLPKPELGIRFLMMPEMTGTAAYFHQHPERIPKTIAALNLDMVGADQTNGSGPLCVEQPPMATPTFVDRFAYKIVEELANNTSTFTGTTSYSTVNYVSTRFSGGSDHYIISDPTIGIPCPMLIQWPDKHYHTTSDSTKHLDENMMKLVGKVAALYSYGLANGEEGEWFYYTFDHLGKVGTYLSQAKDFLLKSKQSFEAFSFYIKYEEESLFQLESYANLRQFKKLEKYIKEKKELILKQADIINDIAGQLIITSELNLNQNWMGSVFSRKFKGPVRLGDEIKELPIEERYYWLKVAEHKAPIGYADFIFYYMNGKRTVREILVLTQYETGQFFPEYAQELLKLCSDLEIITLV